MKRHFTKILYNTKRLIKKISVSYFGDDIFYPFLSIKPSLIEFKVNDKLLLRRLQL